MTTVNGSKLLELAPIKYMLKTKERINGTSFGLSEAGYDIRIKQEILFNPHDIRFRGNPSITVKDGDEVTTHRGRAVLASAIEHFQMPLSLVATVKDKSTWARKFLSVFNTVVEPGWHGYLTLELVFHGEEVVTIPKGSGIAQVLFSTLVEEGDYGDGKYQNQEDKPIESRG